jgi:hypothetical protein
MTEAATAQPPNAPQPSADDDSAPQVSRETAQAYLDKRVKPQQLWFDKRATDAKSWHYRLTGAQMVATAAIPVINVFTHSVMASTVLAFVAAVASGFAQLWKHQEHWVRYRATASALDSLQIRYELRLPPFDGPDAPTRVIEEADRLLGDEGANWTSAIRHGAKPAPVKASSLIPSEDA